MALALDAQANVAGMQSAIRGYLFSGNKEMLAQYENRRQLYRSLIARLQARLESESAQAKIVTEIETLLEDRHRTFVDEIELRRKVDSGLLRLEELAAEFEGVNANFSLYDSVDGRIDELLAGQRLALEASSRVAAEAASRSTVTAIAGTALAIVLGVGVMLLITRRVLTQVGGEPADIAAATEQIAQGNLAVEIAGDSGIAASVERMAVALRHAHAESTTRDWLKTGLARLNEAMQGDPQIDQLAAKVIAEAAGWLGAPVGALYIAQDDGRLVLLGSYAYVRRKHLANEFRPGEGLVGQAALERQQILLHNVPEDYIHVTSGLGERVPRCICVTPFSHEGRLKGVIEIGTLDAITQAQLDYLQQAMPALAVAIESAHARAQLAGALSESRRLTEELQAQQEELKVANEELEEQTQRLQQSEVELRAQQEELQVSNEELEEKNELLERQKREVERARKELSGKADELALASRYKSEFLANMSHELRTPLNSLLLLAQSLARNKDGNLNPEQVESATVIHSSGSDLLNLINEILDLSKIEAGRMDLDLAALPLGELVDSLHASFGHMARDKGLTLAIAIDEDVPAQIVTDRKRLEQILRNLLSNALKFTEHGGISVRFARPAPATELARSGLAAGQTLAIAVADTGIGIPADKHKLIFEAFQQADGTTTRRYGGTGLGLTISRELASLLGGEIRIESVPGQGSTFTLFVPLRATATASPLVKAETPLPAPPRLSAVGTPAAFVADDRDNLSSGDWLILVIEDDPRFAAILVSKCHEKGFKCLAAPSGEAGLELAARYQPKGVVLDLRLPGMDGMAVLAAFKEDTRTRHIPVHVVSVDEHVTESLRRGAIGHTVKPLDTEQLETVFSRLAAVANSQSKRVLVVEDDANLRHEMVQLIGGGDARVDEAASGEEALRLLRGGGYDCVVLDLKLPDIGGMAVLEQLEAEGVVLPPVVVHTALELSAREEQELREHADSIVVKDVRSPERLLDEVSLFLHRVVSQMPERQQQMIHGLYDSDAPLRGKTVLLVDDDMRTTFAVSRLLSEHGMTPLKAENGERALQVLAENPHADIVLMDVMMPVMDGYETMKRIRAQERFKKLPIIALTAKAMPEDRERCLAAGASDYLPKPVDPARLFSLMRVWLYG